MAEWQRAVFLRNISDIDYKNKSFRMSSTSVKYNDEDYRVHCDVAIDQNQMPCYKIKTAKRDPIDGKCVLDVVLDEYFNITQIIE